MGNYFILFGISQLIALPPSGVEFPELVIIYRYENFPYLLLMKRDGLSTGRAQHLETRTREEKEKVRKSRRRLLRARSGWNCFLAGP